MGEQAQANRVQWGGFVPAAEEAGPYYSRQSYEISVAGLYHDIGSYLAAIASLPRIVKPGRMDLKVTADRNPRDPSLPPLLRARFDVETYVLPAPGEVPRDTAAARPAGTNRETRPPSPDAGFAAGHGSAGRCQTQPPATLPAAARTAKLVFEREVSRIRARPGAAIRSCR
jgi:hypothetical protein